jgi:hypothetical protein
MSERPRLSERPHRRDAFVLRIWWEEGEGAARLWRGWIQHAATGEVAYIGTLDDLLAFIEARTGALRGIEEEPEGP